MTNFIISDDTNNQSSLPDWIKNRDLGAKVSAFKILHPQIYEQLKLDDELLWKNYFSDSNNLLKDGTGLPTTVAVTPQVPVNVTEFQKILVAQVMRPDKMVGVMMKSTSKILGKVGF